MRDKGLRVPGLLCFTLRLPLIPVMKLHNSWVATDHSQPALLQLLKQGGRLPVKHWQTHGASIFFYLIVSIADARLLLLSSPGLRLQCGAEGCQSAEADLIFRTLNHFQLFSPVSELSKEAGFFLALFLLWEWAGGSHRGMFYAWLALNDMLVHWRSAWDRLFWHEQLLESLREIRNDKKRKENIFFCLSCHMKDWLAFLCNRCVPLLSVTRRRLLMQEQKITLMDICNCPP